MNNRCGMNRGCGRYDSCKHCINLSKDGCKCEDSMTCHACPMPRRVMLMDMVVSEGSEEESE